MEDSESEHVVGLRDARNRLQAVCDAHGRTESVAIAAADSRILASETAALRAVPHYERAAMDGFAIRAADTIDASNRSPVMLDRTKGRVGPSEAIPVHTGSALPEGADAVVMVEATEERDGQLAVYEAVREGENVAPVGEDVDAEQHLFDAGHRLRASDLALLQATGQTSVEVVEKPQVSVLPTGDELVPAGEDPAAGEIVETNGLQVSTLAEQWGGTSTYRDVVTDDENALRKAIRRDLDHDIVVTTGGSSVGDRDLLPDVLADIGEVLVHGVAIKPGHPVGFGVVNGTPVLLLPGYPVSCLLNAVQFLRPAIAWFTGTQPPRHPTTQARLTAKLQSEPGKRSFARVAVEHDPKDSETSTGTDETDDIPAVKPLQTSGAGVLSSVTFADGWVEIPESREGIPEGEEVTVQQWEPGW